MTRAVLAGMAVVLLADAAGAQSLFPPEVLLLSSIKRHTKEELARLPNISCVETVRRERQAPKGKMAPVDTIRLEVLTDGAKEYFASPGGRSFSDQHPISYAGSGVLGGGFFGPYLKTLLVTGEVTYEYRGEEDRAGRHLVKFDYLLPVMWSGETIQLTDGEGRVGLRGSFWADPNTGDVVRLEINANELPPTLPLTEAVTVINYARTTLGDGITALLPQSAEFRMERFSGEVDRNNIDFTHCRLFGAQSVVRFDPGDGSPVPPQFGITSADDTLRPLPAGLEVAITLSAPIDETMAVGSMIDGVIVADPKSNGAVPIPPKSLVHGRIRRLERYTEPVPYFVVALEFTEAELAGVRYRFYADLVSVEPGSAQPTLEVTVAQTVGVSNGVPQIKYTGERYTLPALPGVASFFIKGAALNLPQGFRTVWRTQALAP